MTFTHTWSISGIFGHPLNGNCVYKVVANLSSTNGANSTTSEHTFFLAPNVLPEASPEGEVSDEIIWVDSLPGFVATSDLTEALIWEWLDRNEDRPALEAENEQQIPADVEINLPFVTA